MMVQPKMFAQRDTLDAIYLDIVTNNKELMNFSSTLESLPKGDPENLLKGIKYFKELPEQVKDSALLIFYYQQRAFSYFESIYELEESFYDENYSPDIEKMKIFNKELESYGVKLFLASEGLITTFTVPGFIESQLKGSVPESLEKYLSYYTLGEKLQILFYEDNYKVFFMDLIKSLYFMEDYIAQESYCNEYVKDDYYYSFMNSIFYDREQALMFGLESFNIKDSILKEQLANFSNQQPISKTSKLIQLFLEITDELSDDGLEMLFYSLENKKCPDIEDCNCKEEFFNYFNMERNIEEIAKCIQIDQ